MRRFIAFVVGFGAATGLLWSAAFPITHTRYVLRVFTVTTVSFVPVWKAGGQDWAYGWLVAELIVCLGLGAGAACFVSPDRNRLDP